MIKVVLVLFFIPLTGLAETIQVPENCLQQKISPCLVRTSAAEMSMGPDSIVKWTSFLPQVQVDVLAGSLHLQKSADNTIAIVNGITQQTNSLFVLRDERKLKILDGDKFILTEYLLGAKDFESVVTKVDFLDKKNLISFLAKFFPNKKALVQYLKKNEDAWLKEFALQNAAQTKVLKRAIASVEDGEKATLHKKMADEKELKRVRETFFYRTFYR